MADLRKVRQRDPLVIKSDTWNAMIDAARHHRDQIKGGNGGVVGGLNDGTFRPGVYVTVRNQTGVDLEAFSAIKLGNPLPTITADNQAEFQVEPIFDGNEIADANDIIVVLQEPIAYEEIGIAMLSGATVAKLNIVADTNTFASPVASTSVLGTGATGRFRVLWKESGTGSRLGVINLVQGGDATIPDAAYNVAGKINTSDQFLGLGAKYFKNRIGFAEEELSSGNHAGYIGIDESILTSSDEYAFLFSSSVLQSAQPTTIEDANARVWAKSWNTFFDSTTQRTTLTGFIPVGDLPAPYSVNHELTGSFFKNDDDSVTWYSRGHVGILRDTTTSGPGSLALINYNYDNTTTFVGGGVGLITPYASINVTSTDASGANRSSGVRLINESTLNGDNEINLGLYANSGVGGIEIKSADTFAQVNIVSAGQIKFDGNAGASATVAGLTFYKGIYTTGSFSGGGMEIGEAITGASVDGGLLLQSAGNLAQSSELIFSAANDHLTVGIPGTDDDHYWRNTKIGRITGTTAGSINGPYLVATGEGAEPPPEPEPEPPPPK